MRLKQLLLIALMASAGHVAADDTPTMGWSSWNTYRVNISDSLIRAQADAMVHYGLMAKGYNYINIDDGFFGGRDAAGNLLIHPKRFPDGLAPVANYIHSLGLKAGIYSDAGANTCGNYWDNDTIAHGVGFYRHDAQDANFFFKQLGFDFIKIDFCGGDPSQNKEHLDLDERERYTAIRQAIDATGRKDVRVNICRWAFPGTWVSSVGSSWRIAADISPNWSAVKRIITANRYLSAYAVGGAFNDMDMLEIGRGLSEAEERTHFGLWCIQSSPLLIGCDLTKIPAASLALISNPELIALNQDTMAIQAHIVRAASDVYLYVKDIRTPQGRERAIAVCNLGDRQRDFTVDMAELCLAGNVEVRDLFTRTDLPTVTDGTLALTIAPHDTRIFALRADRRLERTVYEAETAWLERYQNIGMNQNLGYANYSEVAAASGGAKVGWLGNNADNWLEWRDVYSEEGGVYELTLSYFIDVNRTAYCSVNGGEAQAITCPAGLMSRPKTAAPIRIVLSKGRNTIRLFNDKAWCPDIDKVTLKRVDTPSGIATLGSETAGAQGAVAQYSADRLVVNSKGTARASVWSASGRKLLTTTLHAGSNDLGHYPRGVYYILEEQ